MAPKRNQAKAQRGSFLTRGREQLRQRQQTRQQASRQLPPQGGTTAGSPKARGQRVATAVSQRVTQDVATIRALADNMRRNQARADRQIPADKSPSVRRVGPGGANPKPQGQLPPSQRGGDMRQKGGPLATRQSSAMTERSGGSNARTNSQQRSNQRSGPRPGGYTVVDESPKLPPGRQRGPVRPSIGKVSGPASNPKRPTAPATARAAAAATPGNSQSPQQIISDMNRTLNNSRRILNEMQGIIDKEVGSKPKPIKPSTRGNIATAVTGALGEAAVRPLARAAGQKLGEALRPVGRAIDDRMKGTNSKDERSRKTNTPYQTRFPQARANAQTRVNRIKAGTPDAAPQPNRPSQASTPQRPQIASFTPSRSRSTQPVSSATSRSSSTSTTTPAPTERRVSAATANRESGNYGTSRSDNKLLGDFLRQRMAQRESQTSTNAVGPVKDGNTYAGNLNKPTGRGPVSNANEYGNMLKIDKLKKDKKK